MPAKWAKQLVSYEVTAINRVTRSSSIHTFHIISICNWTNIPNTLYLYAQLHYYCSLHRPTITTSISRKQQNTTLIDHDTAIYSQATNMLLKCHIYAKFSNHLMCSNRKECQYICYKQCYCYQLCDQACCTQMTFSPKQWCNCPVALAKLATDHKGKYGYQMQTTAAVTNKHMSINVIVCTYVQNFNFLQQKLWPVWQSHHHTLWKQKFSQISPFRIMMPSQNENY